MGNQSERERLLAEERQLGSAIADFEHQIRRMRDRLERGGGRSFALETELRQVEENLDLSRRKLRRVRALLGLRPIDRD